MEIQKTKETWKKVILISFSIFLIGLAYAVPDFGSIPPIPDHFSGNVTLYEQKAAIGTQISVYVDSMLDSVYNITETGKYDFYVKTGSENDAIEFKILDKLAGTSTRQGGEIIILNLELSSAPTPIPSSGGSSGGGGGGGGSSGGGGGIISSPPPIIINEPTLGSETNENQSQESEENPEQEKTTATTGITGSAVLDFVKSGTVIATIIVVIALGIGMMLIKFKAPKWKKRFS